MIRIIGLTWDELVKLISQLEISGDELVSFHGYYKDGTKLYNLEIEM
jgi:hypothetical protein